MDRYHAILRPHKAIHAIYCLIPIFLAILCSLEASLDIPKGRTIAEKRCDKPCMNNGYCSNGTCVCQTGWAGQQCEHCAGRVKLNGSNGFFTDGSYNYSASARCTWIISNEDQTGPLLLNLKEFATECCWDNVYIYDGDSAFDKQIAAFSGFLPSTEIVASSGKSIVYFTSDLAFNMMGFNITYQYDQCPEKCNGRGTCVEGRCNCQTGFTGEACDVAFCSPNSPPELNPCGNGMKCNGSKCDCISYFNGDFCQTLSGTSVWDIWYSTNMDKFTPRASHASVLVGSQVWTYGGAYFTSRNSPKDLVVYDIATKTFSELQGKNSPTSRYDHSMVYHKNKLYVFGGVVDESYITNELWSLDMDSLNWTLEFEYDNTSLALPVAVAGHTAHVIGNEMHVFFGYNPYEGYLYQVQIYSFESRKWRKSKVDPYVSGRFGHSSILANDLDKKNIVYVYGGYNAPINSYSYAISDQLLAYDPVDETWTEILTTGVPLFRHSAILLDGLILIFGGNGHNESSSKQSDCYSPKVYVYDITCEDWTSFNNTNTTYVSSLARYGHTAVPLNDSFLVLGGFTGQMKNDILKFSLPKCKAQARDAEDCINSAEGIRCVYVGKSCIQARPYLSYRQTFLNYIKNDNPRLQADCTQRRQLTNVVRRPCSELDDCRSCFSQKGCLWCESTQVCVNADIGCIDGSILSNDGKNCAMSQRKTSISAVERPCSLSTNCYSCRGLSHCSWITLENKPRCISQVDEAILIEEHNRLQAERFAAYSRALATTSDAAITTRPSDSNLFPLTHNLSQNLTCPIPCAQQKSCQKCVFANCMWCGTTQRCVSMDTYMISFPYGQCQSWTTATSADKNHIYPNDCELQKTCADCQAVGPRCGWCDDGSGTGLGKCIQGSDSGPLEANSCPLNRWYFTGQPPCQCNGHSNCSKAISTLNSGSGNICLNCQDHTTGDHCDRCMDTYFGDPRNGGICRRCQCNNQAKTCDPETGDCYCTTKGVTGPHCDKCEPKYTGDPKNDIPCTYELVIDFIFTFKLDGDDAKDKHVNQINFYSTPFKRDTDVQFSITCEGDSNAKVAINLTSNYFEGHPGNMKALMANTTCNINGIKRTYSASSPDFAFGTEANTTFLVRVYDFETPIKIIISFAQSPPINWVLFFVIFAACFIVLLVVAGLLWMIKLRVEWYRNLRRRHDEIEEMASRPFGSVQLELLMNKTDSHATPVAIEPCNNYNAGIYTLVVRLPTGGKEYTPNGTSGLAVASSLCLLTQAQLALLQPPDPADQRPSRKSTLRRFIPFIRS